MKHYDFADKFHALYDKAVKTYAAGQSDQAMYFTADEQSFLAVGLVTEKRPVGPHHR